MIDPSLSTATGIPFAILLWCAQEARAMEEDMERKLAVGMFGRVDKPNPLAPSHRIRYRGQIAWFGANGTLAIREWRAGGFTGKINLCRPEDFTHTKRPKRLFEDEVDQARRIVAKRDAELR